MENNSSAVEESVPREFYDINVTGRHEYLYRDRDCSYEDISGFTLYEHNSRIDNMPILYVPEGVIPVPETTIPLILPIPLLGAIGSSSDNENRSSTFGIINGGLQYMQRHEARTSQKPLYGVTAEIISVFLELPDADVVVDNPYRIYSVITNKTKVVCRQRFKTCSEPRRNRHGVLTASVKILHDVNLPSISSFLRGSTGKLLTTNYVLRRKFETVIANNIPPWVYDSYNEGLLISNIKKELHRLKLISLRESELSEVNINKTELKNNAGYAPEDTNLFCYWTLQNIPFSDEQKYFMLASNNSLEKFRWINKFLKEWHYLKCKQCGVKIAEKHNLISMAVEGPISNFVNPSGRNFELLTVKELDEEQVFYDDVAEFSVDSTWYPGYGWRNVFCKNCFRILGWQFKANDNLEPQYFWAIERNRLVPNNDDTLVI